MKPCGSFLFCIVVSPASRSSAISSSEQFYRDRQPGRVNWRAIVSD
ncbi:MAG TPA: hypothetical protein VNN77_08390 [candidate division Zixibacteria bacterium]|nr:hypothetical protein [candidate division Zixibacteria bacterium]